MGILNKTKTYLVGAMEHTDVGNDWRKRVEQTLNPRGITTFNPYSKPFIYSNSLLLHEDNTIRQNLAKLREEKNYEELSTIFKQIRIFDLALVDKADFIIGVLDLNTYTCGTWEEIFWANRCKKPIFIALSQGKNQCPLWLFGTIPHKYIFDSVEELLKYVTDIDDGTIPLDFKRWRLLEERFR